MERAVQDLTSLNDCSLFSTIAEGIDLIRKNVNRFDSAARHLSVGPQREMARIIGGFAAEEVAKVLILLDAVRCPRECVDGKRRTLHRFYNHLAKGLYIEVCDWQITDYQHLTDSIVRERDNYYIGGPNDVDWIMRNWITSERERMLYLDCIRYHEAGRQQPLTMWKAPCDPSKLPYCPRRIVGLAIALFRLGVATPTGLAVVSCTWRPWRPEPATNRRELRRKIEETVSALQKTGLHTESMEQEISTVIESWPFPLWDIDLREVPKNVDDLRERQKASWWAGDVSH